MAKNMRNQEGNQHQDDPRAVAKLGDGEHQHDDGGGHGSQAIDDHLDPPARIVRHGRASLLHRLVGRQVAGLTPAPRHAALRQREGHEDADGIEGDQGRDTGPERG